MAVAKKTLRPQMNAMSSRWKYVLSELEPVYSPGRRRNKYATIIMLHSSRRKEFYESAVMLDICQRN